MCPEKTGHKVALSHSDICNSKLFMKLTTWSKTMLVKVKFTLEQAMKSLRGSRGIALFFL
jgi:hypothetical protein